MSNNKPPPSQGTLPAESGLRCPDGAKFYLCSSTSNTWGNSFIGCCSTDPCETGKCPQKPLPRASYTWDSEVAKQDCAPPAAGQPIATWHMCNRFLGCCKSDPCSSGTCPEGNLTDARLADKLENRQEFYDRIEAELAKASSTSATANPSTASGSSVSVGSSKTTTEPTNTNAELVEGKQPSNELNNGQVVGIAIGCVIAGLLLGALAAFLLFRRRRKRSPRPEYVQMAYTPGKEKDLPHAPAATGADVRLGQFLLTPKPDAEMTTELGALGALVQQHVEDNYHQQPVHQSPKPLVQALAGLGFAAGPGRRSPEALVRLALDARTRYAALQHIIARVAFDSVMLAPSGSGAGAAAVSLLPPSVAAFAHSVPATERHRGNSEAVAAAMTKWRQLSAFLLHPSRSDRTPLTPPEEATAQQAQQLVKELNRFLEPFVARDREINYEQENHLRQVLIECARFGYLLFSQPSEYRFDYDDSGRLGNIVICPGLERVSDGEGQRYPKPEVLAHPVEGA